MNITNTKRKLTLFFALISLTLSAQNGLAENTYSAQLVSLEIQEEKTAATTITKKTGYQYTKRLSTMYSGYAIELASSDTPLTKDYPAFKKFGKVFHSKTIEGHYSYIILVDFNKRKSVEDYLKNVVAYRVPKAKIFKYLNGQIEDKNSITSTRKYRIVD